MSRIWLEDGMPAASDWRVVYLVPVCLLPARDSFSFLPSAVGEWFILHLVPLCLLPASDALVLSAHKSFRISFPSACCFQRVTHLHLVAFCLLLSAHKVILHLSCLRLLNSTVTREQKFIPIIFWIIHLQKKIQLIDRKQLLLWLCSGIGTSDRVTRPKSCVSRYWISKY